MGDETKFAKNLAYDAQSAGEVQMVEAIVQDQKRILPCAAYLEGEFGMRGHYLGVPCKLGRKGLERIIEIELNAQARDNFNVSVDAVKELIEACKQIDNSLAEEAVA